MKRTGTKKTKECFLPISSKIINSLPDERDREHEAQRSPVRVEVADADAGDELAHGHHQEVQVQEETELLEQH